MNDQTDWKVLRENWRPRWLGSIEEFADIKTQRTRWLDPNEPSPHFSFIEYMNCYLSDLGLTDDDLGYDGWVEHGLITREEADCTHKFHELALSYSSPNGDDYNNLAVLNDPKWRQVVEAARLAQEMLVKLLTDPVEIRLLMEP